MTSSRDPFRSRNRARIEGSDGLQAVSPAIGLVLFVAIAVGLAVVVGAVVLEIGATVDRTTPTIAWETSWDGDELWITHAGGDRVPSGSLSVVGPGTAVAFSDADYWLDEWDESVAAGDSNGIVLWRSGSYRIVWEDGRSTVTLTVIERPSA